METSLAVDDAEMQRILFSTDPPLGEMPDFEPTEDTGPAYGKDMQSPVSLNVHIGAVEALCMADNTDRASAEVQDLLQTGTNPQDLQVCLRTAAQFGREDLVQMLLSAGVPISLGAIKAAITKDSVAMLSLFLQHGWNINEEEAWCIPPLLSYVRSTVNITLAYERPQVCYLHESI